MTSLRKQLMRNISFNAFNNAFNKDLLREEIDKQAANGAGIDELSPAFMSPFFNEVYSEFYNKAKEIIEHKILTRNEFEQLMLANINRETLLIEESMKNASIEKVKNNGKFILGESNNIKVRSGSQDREIYAIDGIENSLDALNTIFSYLQIKVNVDSDEELNEENALQHLYVLNMMSNQVTALKSTYDAMIWRDGYVQMDIPNRRFTFRSTDKDLYTAFTIGKFRIEQAMSLNAMHFTVKLKNSKEFTKLMNHAFRLNRKPRSIESAFVEDGYVKYKIQKGFSNEHIHFDTQFKAPLAHYYYFIKDVRLPAAENLSINDITTMFAEFSELISRVEIKDNGINDSMNIDSFYQFPFRITTESLVQYLTTKTLYSIKQIKSFINILTHNPENRVNLWKRPIIKQGNDLLFPILPISSANALYIIDEWLLAGGYPLDKRGPLFEKHIKDEIQNKMNEKGYLCKIHPNSVLRISENNWQEIDLIAEFSHCILIAEVKCISFPAEARDYYNAYNRFAEGARQINKKVAFIEKHKEKFSKEIPGLSTKPIIKAVFANYPLLTGHSIEGVPCSDINSLGHYITEGAIDKGFVSSDSKGVKDSSNAEHIVYYKNEQEFSANLAAHLVNPVSFQAHKELCEWEMIELSGKGASHTIIVEAIKIKQEAALGDAW